MDGFEQESDFDPARDASREHVDDALGDSDFRARVAAVTDSEQWRILSDFLTVRREQLLFQRPETSDALWLREGALREVHSLLHNGPSLIVQHYDHIRRPEAGR